MSRRVQQAVVVFLALFAAAQLIRPDRTNPPTEVSRTIQAHAGVASGLAPVLDRACGDCHSNRTTWPWYTRIAPLSWVMAYAVAEGRKAVNFSEWGTYPSGGRRTLLAASCRDVSDGKMPGRPWTLLHPEARLSGEDIDTICAAAQQADATAGGL
jgi:heme-binding protein